MTDTHLIAFGAPYNMFQNAHDRFTKNANQISFFKSVNIFSEKNIFEYCKDIQKHKNFLGGKGYGYWIWKYYLISELMNNTPKNDIILYLDIGCSFNWSSVSRMKEYCDMAAEKGSLCFYPLNNEFIEYGTPYLEKYKVDTPHPYYSFYNPEFLWTKADTYYRIFSDDKHYDTPQTAATLFFLKNSEKNQEIVEEIKKIMSEKNYHYISDAPSQIPNPQYFRDHRHDQSVFSLISKKYNLYTIPDETYHYPNWEIWGKDYPIWAIRNKFG